MAGALTLLACGRVGSIPPSSPPEVRPERVRASARLSPRARAQPPPLRKPGTRPRTLHSRQGDELAARFDGRPALSRERGQASYYADSLAGRRTASGEPYDPHAISAAHRSLPFGSIVRVVREDTGQVVYTPINDRGPFVRGRVIDLSRAAAQRIEMIHRGIAQVRVEVVEFGPQRKRWKRDARKKIKARSKRRN